MPFDFPPNPTTGETLEGPFGEIYTWDGEKWTLTAGGSAGGGGGLQPPVGPPEMTGTTGNNETFVLQDQPTINQPVVMGVTDGSNAAPGQVGEYITASSGIQMLTSGAMSVVPGITLTPGDWDVSAFPLFNWGYTTTFPMIFGLTFRLARSDTGVLPINTGIQITWAPMPSGPGGIALQIFQVATTTIRVSSAVAVTITAQATAFWDTSAGNSGQVNALFWARRVR